MVPNKCTLEQLSILYKLSKALVIFAFQFGNPFSVVPVFKNLGEPSDPSNYRPITFRPLFGIILYSDLVKNLIWHGFFRQTIWLPHYKINKIQKETLSFVTTLFAYITTLASSTKLTIVSSYSDDDLRKSKGWSIFFVQIFEINSGDFLIGFPPCLRRIFVIW